MPVVETFEVEGHIVDSLLLAKILDQILDTGADYRLVDVDIVHVRDPIFSGVQRGVGLGVDNDSLMAFSMTGGSISDFQKNATVFNFADLNVTGVTITGGGAQTINAQNGIQLLNSTGTIADNVITNIGYAGPADAYHSRR